MPEQTVVSQRKPAKPSGTERRASMRYPCNMETVCWPPIGSVDKARCSAKVHDLSTGGIGLLVSYPFDLGTILNLTLESAQPKCSRTLLVRVIHVMPRSDWEWLLGCSFATALSEEEVRLFSGWLPKGASGGRQAEQEEGKPSDAAKKLSPKQKRAIQALLTPLTVQEAAAAVKVKETTLRSWLKRPAFKSAYQSARRQAIEAAVSRSQALAGRAIEALERNLACGDAAIEVQAALAILQHAVKAGERSKLEQRPADVKHQLPGARDGFVETVDNSEPTDPTPKPETAVALGSKRLAPETLEATPT